MSAISHEPEKLKFIHTYGPGLHSPEADPAVNDPKWQQRQIEDFVEFAALAEELGYDGLTVTEHHHPGMTCPSPHLLLAAAAARTSRIRLGTAVTVLPLHDPVRVAEEAGTLDLLSGGRFELGLGKGAPGERFVTAGRELARDEAGRAWLEAVELVWLLLTEKDVTYDGEFFTVETPRTLATRPLQDPPPVWLAGAGHETMQLAGRHGWNIMRNLGSNADHRKGLDTYLETAAAHGHDRSGANLIVEKFVCIGRTEAEAAESMGRFTTSFKRFISAYLAGGNRELPKLDGEFAFDGKNKDKPALAVFGTVGQIIDSLQQVIDETGTRRLLVETFSEAESRLLAEEVIPVLRERNEPKGTRPQPSPRNGTQA